MFPCIAKLDFTNPKAASVDILKPSHINIEIKKRQDLLNPRTRRDH